jgi:hypothetical protein
MRISCLSCTYDTLHSPSSRVLPESAVFNMLLPILVGMPPSYRKRLDPDAQLQLAGRDPAHPIVVDDSHDEGDIGPSAPTARNIFQARNRTPSLKRRQINTTTRRRRSRESGSFNHSQSESSLDVYYPDLSAKLPRVENNINAKVAQEPVSMAIRQCLVCSDSFPVAELPMLAECKHLPHTCSTCYAGWIAAQLQGSSWTEARCPESTCYTKMTYSEIQQNAAVEIFQQYDTFIARAALNEDRKLRHSAFLTR